MLEEMQMTSIGRAPVPAIFQDRAVYAQRLADMSGGKQTVEEVTAQLEEFDQIKLKQAKTEEEFYAGKGIPVNGTTQEMLDRDVAQAREARGQHYRLVSGPVLFEAMNVDSAVKAQSSMTGGDLKDLMKYADYLRSEVTATSKVRPDISFSGSWGKNRITTDVNEYVGWLYQAAKGTSPDAG